MKIRLLFLFSTLCCVLYGQSYKAWDVHLGVNFSDSKLASPPSDIHPIGTSFLSSPFYGLSAGAAYQYIGSKGFGYKVGLSYNQWGAKQDILFRQNGTVLGRSEMTVFANNLSIPLMFAYSYGQELKFITRLGLLPSVLINAQREIDSPPVGYLPKETYTPPGLNMSLGGIVETELIYSINKNFNPFIRLGWLGLTSNLDIKAPFVPDAFDHVFGGFTVSLGAQYLLEN